MDTFSRKIKTFVLRSGRMTESQKENYEHLKEKWVIPFEKKLLDFDSCFCKKQELVIEIGFGMAKATSLIAQENPTTNYLGIEVHKAGVAKLLSEIEIHKMQNVRIFEHDALEVLEYMIPDNSISAFHVFFPDPWPKKKHHKRRFMLRPNTGLLAKKLKKDACIYMATDWEDYAYHALEELTATEGLKNKYEDLKNSLLGFAPKQEWRPETGFEKKGKNANRRIFDLVFVKS